jgi:hypothetical protein
MEFGPAPLSKEVKRFRREWNNEIISFCKSFPQSTQMDALLFFMKHSGLSFKDELDFFKTYYVPTWSIIYWLVHSSRDNKRLTDRDIRSAKAAHAMAMFLHALDDHLNDNQLPATHLVLLLRSQAWLIMDNAVKLLADRVHGGTSTARNLIDRYYSSIRGSDEIESLESYCERFKGQMATGLIVPLLMAKKMELDEIFIRSIENAYSRFGIAWRLLDDIKDIETDMMKGTRSAIYMLLPPDLRKRWDSHLEGKSNKNENDTKGIAYYIIESRVIDRLRKRICNELQQAASIADDLNLAGWADELRCLSEPLAKGPNHL